MSVITKESLSRGYFSLYAPIKYACGFIVYKKESELEWLAQCGKCPKVPGSIPGGRMYFWISLVCMAIFACYCAERVRRARAPGRAFASSFRAVSASLAAFLPFNFSFFGLALVHATFGCLQTV